MMRMMAMMAKANAMMMTKMMVATTALLILMLHVLLPPSPSSLCRFAGEWEKTVTRLGRWIDFRNDYKTLDPSFMESVWWVFSQLYAKGLVYKGLKVMPVSTGCATTLANFEAGLNYKVSTSSTAAGVCTDIHLQAHAHTCVHVPALVAAAD
jgi:leucyl-tRNA synthetase